MAARTALPFMLYKIPEPKTGLIDAGELTRRLQAGRERVRADARAHRQLPP